MSKLLASVVGSCLLLASVPAFADMSSSSSSSSSSSMSSTSSSSSMSSTSSSSSSSSKKTATDLSEELRAKFMASTPIYRVMSRRTMMRQKKMTKVIGRRLVK